MTIEKEKFKTEESKLCLDLRMLRRQLKQEQASLVMMEKKLADGRQEVTASEIQFQSLNACINRSNVEQRPRS